MMHDVYFMNYLEACQRLLGLSSSSEQYHISMAQKRGIQNTSNFLKKTKKNLVLLVALLPAAV